MSDDHEALVERIEAQILENHGSIVARSDAYDIAWDIAAIVAEEREHTNRMVDVLVAHQRQSIGACLCGWSGLGESHPEHQAKMLAAAGVGPVRPAQERAIRDAANEMAGVLAAGDMAECAAPVEGEVGRQEAIERRDSLYEEPVEWLQAYADQFGRSLDDD